MTSQISKWYEALGSVNSLVFKIFTPNGTGTGFQILHNEEKGLCGIATAYHVIEHAHEWEEPIKIFHNESGKSLVLKFAKRVIIRIAQKDLAFILFHKSDIPVQDNIPELVPEEKYIKSGVEIGWCGFPAVAPNNLCFFAGHISCYLKDSKSYLVDGVAINGVSGGPAFYISSKKNTVKICGVISAYIPNTATGQVLPGVSFVSSIEPYQALLKSFKSLEDAERKAEKVEKVETSKTSVTAENSSDSNPKKPILQKVVVRKKSIKKQKKLKVNK